MSERGEYVTEVSPNAFDQHNFVIGVLQKKIVYRFRKS